MFKFRRAMLATYGLAVAAALAAGCESARAPLTIAASKTYYPLAVGDHWTYEFVPGSKRYDADVTATRSIGGVKTYAMAIDDQYSFMADLPSGVYQFGQGEPGRPQDAIVFSPPQRVYKLPFSVGESWSTPVLIDPEESRQVVNMYGRVNAMETVSVPAGRFEGCAKILIDDPRDSPADVTTVWLAPGVGIVKTETTLVRSGGLSPKTYATELVRYRINA